jgi:hypothetical protein
VRLFGYNLHVDLRTGKGWLILCSLAALIFGCVGGAEILRGLAAQLFWEKTEGRIIGVDYLGGRRKAPYALFSFTTRDGREIRARTPHTSAFHPARIGDTAPVAYSPRAPQNADLLHAGHLYGFPLFQLLAAGFFAWMAVRHFDGAIHLLRPERTDTGPRQDPHSP